MNDIIQQLTDALNEAGDDPMARAAVIARLAVNRTGDPALFRAFYAACVVWWFDASRLSFLLDVSNLEGAKMLISLKEFSFVERWSPQQPDRYNIHEATRLGIRKALYKSDKDILRDLSARAASMSSQESVGRIESTYHLLVADPSAGATALEKLDRELNDSGRHAERQSLATVVTELERTRLVDGLARAKVILCYSELRSSRGEIARMEQEALLALSLAQAADPGSSTTARARGLLGDIYKARGDLAAAQRSFEECLRIFLELTRQDPENAGWQRQLAVAHSKVGGINQVRGDLATALLSFEEYLRIFVVLTRQDPGNVDWLRGLAVAHSWVGGIHQARGDLAAAQRFLIEDLRIFIRLTIQDPGNADWQRDLAVAHSKVGGIHQAQGDLVAAQGSFEEDLRISLELTRQDLGNADWQRDLAIAHSNVGGIHLARGDLAAALRSFEEYLRISLELTRLDPGNAIWQHELAVAYSKVGDIHQTRGDLATALRSFEEYQRIFVELTRQDPGNAGWQRNLAAACSRIWETRKRLEGNALVEPNS